MSPSTQAIKISCTPESLISNIASKPAAFGEIGMCVWLSVIGINEKALTVGQAEKAKEFVRSGSEIYHGKPEGVDEYH